MIIYDLNNKPHNYTYVVDRDYQGLSDRFLKNTYKALDFLYKTNALTITYKDDGVVKTLDIIDVLVADVVNGINIVYSQRKNYYRPSTNTVGFYDTHGIVFRKNHRKRWFSKNKGYNSPMAVLAHELIHCYNELFETDDYKARKLNITSRKKKIDSAGNDISYPNKEEEFVIRMTNQVVKRLGEDKRSNYGRSYYEVEEVTDTRKKGKRKNRRISQIFNHS
ncbi:hypothetical protein [Dokdonia donghaensis]|uniref:Uncharacterized protein n=1 Tax=Dokdonia donghaensis DSW-1 TaxID=1300343 RepID=A0A0A2GUE4_9FLAO|nr:hypothetical protein [Dokdonia donghaensis]ANH59471.1 hypothetical protein I597_0540 [Dokdonia donghaensis DSW-1]KGO06854.1 hypothetical protein NV36_08350 [Dokdonia donghaensis DSW-1]